MDLVIRVAVRVQQEEDPIRVLNRASYQPLNRAIQMQAVEAQVEPKPEALFSNSIQVEEQLLLLNLLSNCQSVKFATKEDMKL